MISRVGCWDAAFPQIPGPKPAFFTQADTDPEVYSLSIFILNVQNIHKTLLAEFFNNKELITEDHSSLCHILKKKKKKISQQVL